MSDKSTNIQDAELGGVGPVIVVPGTWTQKEIDHQVYPAPSSRASSPPTTPKQLQFLCSGCMFVLTSFSSQAQAICASKYVNSGHICASPQVVLSNSLFWHLCLYFHCYCGAVGCLNGASGDLGHFGIGSFRHFRLLCWTEIGPSDSSSSTHSVDTFLW